MRGHLLSAFLTLAMALGLFQLASRQEFVMHHGEEVAADGNAADCLLCHDGSVAGETHVCRDACTFRGPHAVLKPYPPPGGQNYAPLAEITARGVRLEGGAITCISCHEIRNQTRYHLLIDNTNSRLCLLCHRI